MPRKKKVPTRYDKYQPAPMPEDAAIDAVLSRIRQSNVMPKAWNDVVDATLPKEVKPNE